MSGEIITVGAMLSVSIYWPLGHEVLEFLQKGARVHLSHSTGSRQVFVYAALPSAILIKGHFRPNEHGLLVIGHLSTLAHSTRRIIGLFITHPHKTMPAWLYPEGAFWRVRVNVDADGAVQKDEPTTSPHPTHSHHHHERDHT